MWPRRGRVSVFVFLHIVGAGRNKVPGGGTELVQVEGYGGFDVEFVCIMTTI